METRYGILHLQGKEIWRSVPDAVQFGRNMAAERMPLRRKVQSFVFLDVSGSGCIAAAIYAAVPVGNVIYAWLAAPTKGDDSENRNSCRRKRLQHEHCATVGKRSEVDDYLRRLPHDIQGPHTNGG